MATHPPSPLQTQVGALTLTSPLMNASGTFCAETFGQCFPLNQAMGAWVSKTVLPQPSGGNAQQRTVELPRLGMLNSIGLQGKGVMHTLDTEVPVWQGYGVPLVLSLSADSVAAFEALMQFVAQHPNRHAISAIELNLSCPNVHGGGSLFGAQPHWVRQVVAAVKALCPYPLWVKLTPNTGEFLTVAHAAVEAGADALCAINTVLGAHVDIHRRKPSLARISGGYSGPGIRPIAIHHVLQLAQALPQVPLIGSGGVVSVEDVLEFVMAGCSAVQIGTASFANPLALPQLHQGLSEWLQAQGVATLSELVGCAVPKA